jgi:PAS domain S-box-containing protein
MLPLRLSKPIIAAVWAGIFGVGAVAGWMGYRNAREQLLDGLVDDTKRCAVVFEPGDLQRLTGTRADAATPVYAAVKRKLIALQAVNPQVRAVFVVRFVPETERVIYLADSMPAGRKEEALPGDEFPSAAMLPGLQTIIHTGLPAADGPLAGDTETWLAGYALVAESPSAKPDAPRREIVGMDLASAEWRGALWAAAATRSFAVWLLFGLPFAGWLIVRRQFEQREAIRNLSEAMEQSHSALMVIDLENCIEYVNRGLCQQTGYSRRELIGRNWRDFQMVDIPPERLAELASSVRSGQAWQGEWFNRRKDGTVYPVRGVITPVKKRDGTLSCFVAVFDDMTEIKRQEAELREARDLAQAADRAKGQFLATMSHEVRTPLNGIVGFTSLLLGSPLTAEQRDYAETIRASGEALMQLTGDILDYARIETGKLKLELAPCDPRECVEEAFDLLAGGAEARKLSLLHWVDDEVPAAILADSFRLRQVLVNLVGNAVKFTETGEVEVRVGLAPEDGGRMTENGGPRVEAKPEIGSPASALCSLIFSVRDTGIGIAATEGAKLFKPFSQLDSSSTRKQGGTGLGLAISRHLVQLMGGDLSFVSEPGRGSTFAFTLRAAVASPAVPAPSLDGLRLALVMPPGAFRREFVRLAARWRAGCIEADTLTALPAAPWDLALVAVDEPLARTFVAQATPTPGLAKTKAFALVPVTLGTELRAALRPHFRLLINYPPHHAALFGLLRGLRPVAPLAAPPPTHFGLRVLLVEDNVVNQRLTQKMLTNLGCTWHMVANGRLAVEELAREGADYDFVLLDLHMPELDGIDALKEIRAGRAGLRAQTVWVAAFTADAREEQKARAFAAGVDDYLVKPTQRPDLEAAFHRYRAARTPRDG